MLSAAVGAVLGGVAVCVVMALMLQRSLMLADLAATTDLLGWESAEAMGAYQRRGPRSAATAQALRHLIGVLEKNRGRTESFPVERELAIAYARLAVVLEARGDERGAADAYAAALAELKGQGGKEQSVKDVRDYVRKVDELLADPGK